MSERAIEAADEIRRKISEMRMRPQTLPVAELPEWLNRYANAYRSEIDPDPLTVADYLERAAKEIAALTAAERVAGEDRWNEAIEAAAKCVEKTGYHVVPDQLEGTVDKIATAVRALAVSPGKVSEPQRFDGEKDLEQFRKEHPVAERVAENICNYPNCDGGPHSGKCHVDCRPVMPGIDERLEDCGQ